MGTRPEWFHTSPVSPPVAWPVVSCLCRVPLRSASGLWTLCALREMRSNALHTGPHSSLHVRSVNCGATHSLNSIYEVRVADPVNVLDQESYIYIFAACSPKSK